MHTVEKFVEEKGDELNTLSYEVQSWWKLQWFVFDDNVVTTIVIQVQNYYMF